MLLIRRVVLYQLFRAMLMPGFLLLFLLLMHLWLLLVLLIRLHFAVFHKGSSFFRGLYSSHWTLRYHIRRKDSIYIYND